MSDIKKAWLVCSMDNFPISDDEGKTREFKSEQAAVKAAKDHVNNTEDSEAWVYALSFVIERPDIEPTVTKVK